MCDICGNRFSQKGIETNGNPIVCGRDIIAKAGSCLDIVGDIRSESSEEQVIFRCSESTVKTPRHLAVVESGARCR